MTHADLIAVAEYHERQAKEFSQASDNLAALHHGVASIETLRRAKWHERTAQQLRELAGEFKSLLSDQSALNLVSS